VRIGIDKDLDGWRPERGRTDKHGQEIEDREYNATDFDRSLVLEKRTELVAAKVTEFLKSTDRFAKTIVFCDNIDHAERMRQALVNANPDLAAANSKYVMRITGDNDEGKAQLDNFIDPESTFPVIATTSHLMSTGVDAQTCHLIVLDKRINSMTEFKQIIGRGTRINEDYNKFFFTIMDFKQATALFADPKFDGDPVQVYEPKPDESPVPPDEAPDPVEAPPGVEYGDLSDASKAMAARERPIKYYVDDVEVVVATERVQYLDADGRLITESLKDFTRKTVRQAAVSRGDRHADRCGRQLPDHLRRLQGGIRHRRPDGHPGPSRPVFGQAVRRVLHDSPGRWPGGPRRGVPQAEGERVNPRSPEGWGGPSARPSFQH
jgi:type I restriction enzyme R subunit